MTKEDFISSISGATPPSGLSPAMQALWWDASGDWDRAHDLTQEQDDRTGAWVHAYLHRKEGDIGNAGYWYRRAARSMPDTTLDDEWHAIVSALLSPT